MASSDPRAADPAVPRDVADKPVKQSRKNQHATMRRRWRTDGTYERLLAEQKGVCGICGVPQEKRMDIDHDHVTDELRGLLCRGCNIRLGRERSATWLFCAAHYLRRQD